MVKADILSCAVAFAARDADKTGPDSIDGADQAGVFLIRAYGLTYCSSSKPEVALGGLRPPRSAGIFPASSLVSPDFWDFRRRCARMDDMLSSPPFSGNNSWRSSGVPMVLSASGPNDAASAPWSVFSRTVTSVSPLIYRPVERGSFISSLAEGRSFLRSRTRAKAWAVSGVSRHWSQRRPSFAPRRMLVGLAALARPPRQLGTLPVRLVHLSRLHRRHRQTVSAPFVPSPPSARSISPWFAFSVTWDSTPCVTVFTVTWGRDFLCRFLGRIFWNALWFCHYRHLLIEMV